MGSAPGISCRSVAQNAHTVAMPIGDRCPRITASAVRIFVSELRITVSELRISLPEARISISRGRISLPAVRISRPDGRIFHSGLRITVSEDRISVSELRISRSALRISFLIGDTCKSAADTCDFERRNKRRVETRGPVQRVNARGDGRGTRFSGTLQATHPRKLVVPPPCLLSPVMNGRSRLGKSR
jgi:hypothetical protein